MTDFTNLFSALFNCFAIIIFGYIAARTNLVTPSQAIGIGNFVGFFALPALLLKNMIQLNFDTVSWTFMFAIFLAKTIVFIVVLAVALIVLRRKGVGKGAIYAIFATQSNDFAMGYPIVQVLYSKTHPELIQYIYLLAPISLMILNPIGMFLLEIDKRWRIREASEVADKLKSANEEESPVACEGCSTSEICQEGSSEESSAEPVQQESCMRILLHSLKSLFLNPIVSMVFVGLIFHFIFNRQIPTLLDLLLETLANSFSAVALFYLGLNMIGKIGKQTGVQLFVPATLIAAKILLLPIIAEQMVFLLNNVLPVMDPNMGHLLPGNGSAADNKTYLSVLSDYAFLYGTFPTAPSVFIYAGKYGVELEVIASAMVVCTTLSAPMMYVSAWTLSIPMMDDAYYTEQIALTNQDISIVGALCAAWCIAVFICTKKFQRSPHFVTTVLTFAMFIASFMTVIFDFALKSSSSLTSQIVVFYFIFFGVKAARFYAAALAICLVIYKYHGEAQTRMAQWYLVGIPPVLALIVGGMLVAFGTRMLRTPDNPVFMFGRLQDIIAFGCLLVTLLVCLGCLIALFRLPHLFVTSTVKRKRSSTPQSGEGEYSERNHLIAIGTDDDDDSSDQDLLSSQEEEEEKWFRKSSGDPQLARHIVLLMILCVSNLIGVVLTGWRVSGYAVSGSYFEIGFLDAVCNFGQPFFVFLIFGLDEELILDPLVQLWHRCTKGNSEITLQPLSEVDQETLKQCHVFVTHHINHCRSDLLCRKRHGLKTYNNVLTGTSLCSWLVEVGLAADRHEALLYGRHLMQGRVVEHVNKSHHFYDKDFLYKFETPHRRRVPLASPRTASMGNEGNELRPGKCKLGLKQYSYERFLNDFTHSGTATPRLRSGKVIKHVHRTPTYDTESFCSGEDAGSDEALTQSSRDVIISVAQVTADIAQSVTDDGEGKSETIESPAEVETNSRQDRANLIDW